MNLADEDIEQCLAAMRAGGCILYPTDTVWGIGCDCRDAAAVERLFRLKQRPEAKAMLLLAADEEMAAQYADFSADAGRLIAAASRPTTVIYPGAKGVAPALIAPDGTIGIRIPADGFCRELCRRLGAPVVSTSANISGQPAAGRFDEIADEIADGVDYVCRSGRDNPPSAPSDIYKVADDGTILTIRASNPAND